jgi:hypothetical protein
MYKFSIQVEKLFFQFLCHFSYVGLAPWGVAVPAEGDMLPREAQNQCTKSKQASHSS